MKRVVMISLLLLLALSLVTGCMNRVGDTAYRALTQEEIDRFVREEHIEPLSIETAADTTVILHDRGIYYLSKHNDQLIKNHSQWGSTGRKVKTGMTRTGSPHVFVIINDETLLKDAYLVEAVFGDGNSVSELTKGNRGFVLFYDKNQTNLSIRGNWELNIYDEKEEVIYYDTF
ncbi:MAG: hypothetical protein H0Z33_09550 [Bacillaceae bacterium]|nr:hypothetical protein [Bacillaceae bacterium]